MTDTNDMTNKEEDVNANGSGYASLTAGLLARKGEAVPAAAAFTAEAIAQHIPARRLAQEAERVLDDRHPVVDRVATGEETASLMDASDQNRWEPDSRSAHARMPARAASEGNDENWFESMVSSAINDALQLSSESGEPASAADQLANEVSVPSGATTLDVSDDPSTKIPASGCSDKAAQVRDAIKSGKPAIAPRSAMRLDPRRFIRLSLAAQKLELTSQEVMVAALDTYLDTLDEEVFSDCACMKKGLI